MANNYLLQSQKNEILFLIKKAGLNPALFIWTQVNSKYLVDSQVSRINYLNTEFFYTFDMNGETHYAFYSPADNSYIGSDYPVVWHSQKRCFENWLKNLIKEQNEPDLWESIRPSQQMPPSNENKNHTYSTSPTPGSPAPKEMSDRLDRLFHTDVSQKTDKTGSTGFVIKRYYGKA